MGDSSQEDAAHGDEDHGLGDVEAFLEVADPGPALADAVEDRLAPALSEMSAGVRLTIISRPSVSMAMWRLRPTIPADNALFWQSCSREDTSHPSGRSLIRPMPYILLRPCFCGKSEAVRFP